MTTLPSSSRDEGGHGADGIRSAWLGVVCEGGPQKPDHVAKPDENVEDDEAQKEADERRITVERLLLSKLSEEALAVETFFTERAQHQISSPTLSSIKTAPQNRPSLQVYLQIHASMVSPCCVLL